MEIDDLFGIFGGGMFPGRSVRIIRRRLKQPWEDNETNAIPPNVKPTQPLTGPLVFHEPETKFIAETGIANVEAKRKLNGKIAPFLELDYLTEDQARLELRYRQLVDKGTTTARELFQLDFGKMPVAPNEMSQFHHLDTPFNIQWENIQHSTWGHTNPETGEIGMNRRVRYERPLMGTVSHEHIHSLLGAYEKTAPIPNETFLVREEVDGVFGAEMSKAIFPKRSQSNSARDDENAEMEKIRVAQSRMGYLLSRIEMLPRLHQMMVDIYRATGEIPQNRIQLYAALNSAGITTPPEIEEQIRDTKNAAEVAAFRKPIQLAPYETTRELSRQIAQLPADSLKAFWDNVIPAYTGELWDLYGHRNGREKMGVPTPDPEGARAFLHMAEKDGKKRSHEWEAAAREFHPEYAVQLFQRMAEAEKDEAAMAILRVHGAKIRESWRDETGPPVLWIAAKGSLPVLEFALKNGFSANEEIREKNGTVSGSTLDVMLEGALVTPSSESRDHLVAAGRLLLKYGADSKKLLHQYDDDRQPVPITQWMYDEHGTRDAGKFLDKQSRRKIHAERPSGLRQGFLVETPEGIMLIEVVPIIDPRKKWDGVPQRVK